MADEPPTDYPDIRPCIVCGIGVLCDESYPADVEVLHVECVSACSTD